jgi:hypothetical protein
MVLVYLIEQLRKIYVALVSWNEACIFNGGGGVMAVIVMVVGFTTYTISTTLLTL